MKEESLLFKPVKEISKKEVISAPPNLSIRNIALLMKENNISGLIISKDNYPIGIITDRDFRNKVISQGLNPENITAQEIMTTPVLTVRENDYIFEAIYKMTKNNIHRLVVVNEMGMISGVLTDTDIIKFQTNTPLYFVRELEYAVGLQDLKELNKKSIPLINYLLDANINTADLIRFISHINDSIILRCIKLIISENYLSLPEKFAFLVLGSEGRMEQTLKTDQDNAIVYSDDLNQKDIEEIKRFSEKLIESLIYIGIPECPGGIMAKNDFWRRPLSEWIMCLRKWMSNPTPENILNYSMFSDLRTIYGDISLEKALKKEIKIMVEENELFLAHMANNSLRFSPPLGIFGNIKVESQGENKGRLDVKKAGIFPITEGIKILSLEAGELNGGTFTKIRKLWGKDILSEDDLLEMEDTFDFFMRLRLKNNIKQYLRGENPSNYINPKELKTIERDNLKQGFRVVNKFQNFLKDKYQLDFIR